jgi:hypothetical protein
MYPGSLVSASIFCMTVFNVSGAVYDYLNPYRAQHCQRRRLLALLRTRQPAVRGQALAGVACRRRQKKYENPQGTPVAAAQPHASGPRRPRGG